MPSSVDSFRFIFVFVSLSLCVFFHPLHWQHVSPDSNTSPTSDRNSSKVFVCFFVSPFVYLSVCLFVCSIIHCTANMFLLIPTQVQFQTGIQVSYCIISLCFCIRLFVYLFMCLFVCFFVCSFIHCTGNMFLLIPTQVQLQTGIQVRFCKFLFLSLCLFVCFSICLFLCVFFHPLHQKHVSPHPDSSSTSDRH